MVTPDNGNFLWKFDLEFKKTLPLASNYLTTVPKFLVNNNELAGKRKRISSIKWQEPNEAGPSFSSRPSGSSPRKMRKKKASNGQDFHLFNSDSTSFLFLEHLDDYLGTNSGVKSNSLSFIIETSRDHSRRLTLANEQSRIPHQHPRARARTQMK